LLASYSDKLRKIAEFIERDNTPSDVSIGDQSESIDQEVVRDKRRGIDQKSEGEKSSIRKKPVKEEVIKSTAMPEQRRPRRQLEYSKKWNEDSSTGNMREYMKEYRARGDDKDVPGIKSTYHKRIRT
jgi:hypothetical protein